MAVDYRKLIGDGMCVRCRKPLGALFRRLRCDIGVIRVGAAQRLMGLTQFLGGSSALADVFNPDPRPLVEFSDDSEPGMTTAICLCNDCWAESLCPGELAERVSALAEQQATTE